jgi:hypothetical protein
MRAAIGNQKGSALLIMVTTVSIVLLTLIAASVPLNAKASVKTAAGTANPEVTDLTDSINKAIAQSDGCMTMFSNYYRGSFDSVNLANTSTGPNATIRSTIFAGTDDIKVASATLVPKMRYGSNLDTSMGYRYHLVLNFTTPDGTPVETRELPMYFAAQNSDGLIRDCEATSYVRDEMTPEDKLCDMYRSGTTYNVQYRNSNSWQFCGWAKAAM